MTPTEIKFCSRVIIFSPFYQVLVFKIRKGFFLGDPVYVCIYTYMCISINPSIYLSIYLSNLLIISVFEPGSGDSHDEEYKKIHEDYKNLVSMSTITLRTSPLIRAWKCKFPPFKEIMTFRLTDRQTDGNKGSQGSNTFKK